MLRAFCVLSLIYSVNGFSPKGYVKRSGTRSMTASMDILAGLSVIAALNSAPNHITQSLNTFPVAVVETRQGLYGEYTVQVEEKAPVVKETTKSTFKTAEETEESKTKYWAILGTLLFGSFVIPMLQYYWYVAEED